MRRAGVVLAVLGLAACGGGAPRPELQPGTFTIGVAAPSGPQDRAIVETARIAAREVNRDGGIDEAVKLDVTQGRADVDAFLLPCSPAAARRLAARAQRRGVPAIATCDRHPSAWLRFPVVWPAGMSANREAAALADYARDQGWETAFVTGGSVAGYFRKAAAAREITLVDRPSEADVVVLDVPAREAARYVRRLHRRGVEAAVLGSDLLERPRFYRRLEGVTFAAYGFPDPGSKLDEIYERYRALHGSRPDESSAALGYDAVKVLVYAVADADSTAPRALFGSLHGLDVGGSLATIHYPENGGHAPDVEIRLLKVEDGLPVPVAEEDPSPDHVPAP